MTEDAASNEWSSDKQRDSGNTSQFVSFEIDHQQYAIPIEKIQEIVILEQITPTPQVSQCVEGVTNLRGAIIPIINLRRLLGVQPRPADNETRTIVVNVGERTMGCTVDSVSQVIRIPLDSIQPAPDTLTGSGNHDIAGFAKLSDDLVILLDLEQLLNVERLQSQPTSTPGLSNGSPSPPDTTSPKESQHG